LSTGPLAPSLAELVPSSYYDSPRRKENNSAFKIMNMTSIFTDSSFIAHIFLQMRIIEYTIMITLYELMIFQRTSSFIKIWIFQILLQTSGPDF
jgi:hypothetical protein